MVQPGLAITTGKTTSAGRMRRYTIAAELTRLPTTQRGQRSGLLRRSASRRTSPTERRDHRQQLDMADRITTTTQWVAGVASSGASSAAVTFNQTYDNASRPTQPARPDRLEQRLRHPGDLRLGRHRAADEPSADAQLGLPGGSAAPSRWVLPMTMRAGCRQPPATTT